MDISYDLYFLVFIKKKRRRTYTEEQLDDIVDYIVQVASENSELLRCRIQSHHSNAVHYYA